MHKKAKGVIGVIILSLFIGQFLGSSILPHSHVINGMVVAHAHPYNAFSKQEHHHSQDEIILLHKISHAIFISPVVLSVSTPTPLSLTLPISYELAYTHTPSIAHYLLRAPPFVVFN